MVRYAERMGSRVIATYPHIVPVEVELEHGERTHIDDAQTVRLARRERQRRVLIEPR